MKLEIGQKVWYFDQNRRIYRKDSEATVGPIWREHWVPYSVVFETSRSYVVGIPNSAYHPFKISKKDLSDNIPIMGFAFSEEEIDQKAFVERSWDIADQIRQIRDYKTLRTICDLIGYEPKTRVSE